MHRRERRAINYMMGGPLGAVLDRVRARLRLRLAVEGAAPVVAAAGGLGLAVVAAAAVFGPSAGWRSAAFGCAALGGLGLVAAIGRALLAWRGDDEVARFLDGASGGGDLTWSALELERALPEPRDGTSPALARALVRQAAARTRALDLARLIDFKHARRRAAVALAVALAWAALALLAPSLLKRGFAALGAREAVTEAARAPILADIELGLAYPAYTGLAPRSLPGSSGDVLAPAGTAVTVRARPLVPAAGGELYLEDAAGKLLATRPIAVAGGAVTAGFTVGDAAAWRLALKTPSGRAVAEPAAHRIDVDPDRAPRVDLAAPADDLEVPGPRKIELAWAVDDDYGVGELSLVWRAASGDDTAEHRKPLATVGARTGSGKVEWDLAELELSPGVRVAYHLEAKDNDTVPGPNVGASRTLYVRIYSPAEKHEELLGAERQLLDRAVGLLGDRIDGARDEAEAWAALHGKNEAFLGELGRVAADLEKDKLAPKDLAPALAGIHERLARLTRDEDAPLKEARRGKKHALAALRDGNPRHVTEMERDTLLLDDLLSRQLLEQLLAVTDEMQRSRDRLKELMEQYKKTRSEAVRKEIEREMRELSRKLAELAAKASKLQGEVPDEFLNREAMGDNDLDKRLQAIRDMLAKGDVEQAMAELQKLSQSLDKMAQSLEQDLRGFRNERFSSEERALSELENQLADLEHDERQLQSETEQVREAARQRTREIAKDRVEPFLKKARAEAAEMRRKLNEIDPRDLAPYDQEPLERARRRVDDLARALEQGDLDQARSMAREAADNLRGLGFELTDEERRMQWAGAPRPQVRKARERVDEAGQTAKRLADEMDQVFPKPNELLGPGDRKKMSELRERQAALRKRTDEARQQLEKKSKEGAASLGDGMKQASQHMQRAERSLDEGDPRDSAGEEQQAADQLKQMRRDAHEQRRPRQEGAGGGMEKETVKIPGADEYRGPQEFRRDLLDAMKREAPKDYQEQVKRYYQELAR